MNKDCVKPKSNLNGYPALLLALADPSKRAKLRSICEQLKRHGQLRNLYYGFGEHSIPFDVVSEYLAVLT